MSQLLKLAKPIHTKYVDQVKKGGGPQLDYVSHSTITEYLLGILGPFSQEVEPIRGHAKAFKTSKNSWDAVENAIVGAMVTLTVEVDGRTVRVTEVGDVENPAMKDNDGARLKDAVSDGLKRCAMRLGLGLHLWSGNKYMLYGVLNKKATD